MYHRLAVVLLAFPCSAQAVWTNKTTAGIPNSTTALAYDQKAGTVVTYGNDDRATTWTWDGTNWKSYTGTGPAARRYYRMAYDTTNGRVLMLSSEFGTGQVHAWSWDGSRWSEILTTTMPKYRTNFGCAYDDRRKVLVMFGGRQGSAEVSETWEFDGKDWRQRSSGGPRPRSDLQMAYDGVRGEVVLFGGQDDTRGIRLGDTWVWNGSYWREHFGIPGPAARVWGAMAFDTKRGVAVLTGGTDRQGKYYNDTWEWDGAKWTQIVTSGAPPTSVYGELVYDSARELCVHHLSTQLWLYSNRPLPKAAYAAFGGGCAGKVGVPVLAAATGSLPRLGRDFRVEMSNVATGSFTRTFLLVGVSDKTWMGNQLPLGLAFLGMPGCQLLVSMDVVLGFPLAKGTAALTFRVPNDPTLAGGRFFLQGLVFEPGANAAGAIVSNGGAGSIGS